MLIRQDALRAQIDGAVADLQLLAMQSVAQAVTPGGDSGLDDAVQQLHADARGMCSMTGVT